MNSQVIPLSVSLKEQTKPNHQSLEKKIIERIKAMNSPQDYAQLLQLFYGYFGGLEQRIDAVIDKNLLPDYSARRKATALAADLFALGAVVPAPAMAASLPLIENNAQAFGALYVIEGSVLGGPHIVNMIAPRLQMEESNGFSFFKGYGANTPMMWQGFKDAMDRLPAGAGVHSTVIHAANEVFDGFSRWIDQH